MGLASPRSAALVSCLRSAPAMAANDFLFTSESVSEGHPDKVCDRISDEVVDLFLGEYPLARVACETLATTNRVVIAGEVRPGPGSRITPELIAHTARMAIKDIGYEQDGFHWHDAKVEVLLHEQSADIAMGVDAGGAEGRGRRRPGHHVRLRHRRDAGDDAGADPVRARAPAPARRRSAFRQAGAAGPRREEPVHLALRRRPAGRRHLGGAVDPACRRAHARPRSRSWSAPTSLATLPEGWMCPEAEFYVNPTGKFVIGGPDGDAGLTGRKIIVDTYGGAAPHGGGAFSGKDPTKVDRSAAYAARYLAKNVVAAGLARRCVIQLSYAIGVSKPLSIYVDTYGTGEVDELRLGKVLNEVMNLSPRGIREHLQLNRPIYARTSAYGHFGRDVDADGGFSWERTDLAAELRRAFN